MNSNWHAQMMVDEINKQSERDALLKETHDTLLKMQEDSKKESAIESKRFIIQTVLSVASLIVAAIAAVASIIAFGHPSSVTVLRDCHFLLWKIHILEFP